MAAPSLPFPMEENTVGNCMSKDVLSRSPATTLTGSECVPSQCGIWQTTP